MNSIALQNSFLKVSLITVLLIISQTLLGRNFYFSTSTGDDSRTSTQAQNQATPWKSISKLNSFFASLAAGDSILFKRGEVFYGSIRISKSGTSTSPIVLSAYGQGSNPTISGFQTVTGWTNKGSNIWESAAINCKPTLNMVTVNNVNTPMGRYPNTGASNGGYLTYETSSGSTSITDNQLTSSPNWTGAEAVVRKTAWIINRCPITSHVNGTLTFTDVSGYGGYNGWGYFIQNDIRTLDATGEWFLNKTTKKLSMYFSGNNPNSYNVKASTLDTLVFSSGNRYINFVNLSFEGGNLYAFYINAGDHISIRQCNLDFMGKDAIYYPNHSYMTVYGCNISNINDNVISGNSNCYNSYIGYCNINKAHLIPGNTAVGDGHGFGIELRSNNSIAEFNTVKNVGYLAILLSSNNSIIRNNYIDSACLIKDDGAAIYISGAVSTIMSGRIIQNNIVSNSLGNGNGKTAIYPAKANGIYVDGYGNNVTIEGNTVSNSSSGGIYLGFYSHDVKIINNTLFNNTDNLKITENDLVDNNCTFNGNIFAANGSTGLFSAINGSETKVYRPIESFGTWSGNYFIKPFDDKNVLFIRYNIGTKQIFDGVTYDGWKRYDATRKGAPLAIKAYKVNSLIGSNKFSNENFTSNTTGLRSSYNASATLSWDNTNKISGGSALLNYNLPLSSTNDEAVLYFNVGSVTAGKKYILKFDLLGTKPDRAVMVYIRKNASPYTPLTPKDKYFAYTTTVTTNEILIEPTTSELSTDVFLSFRDEDGTVYLDNVSFYEADVTKTNPDEMIQLEFNPTNTNKIISLPGSFVDVKGTPYSNSITLQPFTSALLFKTGNIEVNQPPVILNQNFQINENSPNGTQIGKVSASDPNVGQTLIYSILSGNTNGTFSINSTSGIITVANSTGLNFESLSSYSLVIRVQDNGTGSLTSQATITITIANVNENPVINNQSFSMLSNAANGTVVGTVVATDPDAGQTKTYSIVSGNTNSVFSINSTTGVVTITNAASINILTTPTYSLIVRVLDNGVGNLSSQATITVNLTNSNSCTATGNIAYQVWNNLGGTVTISTLTSNINYPGNPTSSTLINSLEAPINQANEYGARIAGYICAPLTGSYTFWIASDDNGELWLSSDDQETNKIRIAYHTAYTASREWNKYATQKSISINLIQGKKYYIEALLKDGTAGDNLAVGWLKPGQTGSVPSEIIPGSVLSPIETNQAVLMTSLTLTSTMTINTSSEALILASVSPSNTTNETLVWNTSNAAIATVNNNGLVTGIAPGNVTITATSTDGSNKSGTCAVTVYEPACSAVGTITYQVWNNIGGTVTISTLTSNINYPENPTSSAFLNSFEAPINQANEYGARIAGYICAPLTGSYTFWIASDDNGELWLSSDDQETNKIRIAYHNAYTASREWNKYTTQKSISINLIQGKKYYIEALMKDGPSGDNLAVGWLKPGQSGSVPSEIIPGSVLSPLAPSQIVKSPDCSAVGTITYDIWNDIGSGLSISDLTNNTNYPNNPSSSSLISSMEGTANQANNYGARIAGYICAPATGNYTFWISSDDYGELWLSSDDQPSNKEKIAYHNGYTGVRIWNKYLTQKSVEINLIKGHKYYIEALMKEATGSDNLAVGWLKPGQTGSEPSEVIPGSVLSPLGLKSKVAYISSISSNISNETSDSDVNLFVYPNPISSGVLNVKIENLSNTATLRIYSVTGTLCYEKVIEETGVIQIDRSLLASGVYVIRVFNNAFIKSTKLVVR